MSTQVVIVDYGCGVAQAELERAAAALTLQVNQHAGLPSPLGWGIEASVRAASADPAAAPKPDEWILGLFVDPDQPGALGYHDRTDAGLPRLHVFPKLDTQDGVPWTVTASHELLEARVNAQLNLAFQDQNGDFWAGELCDATEQDTYGIGSSDDDEVMVSNFVLPAYFSPPMDWATLKLDYLGLCKTPGEIRPGGYGQKFEPGTGWQQVTNVQRRPRPYRLLTGRPGWAPRGQLLRNRPFPRIG